MDSPILLLEHTDQATKQMLENVRKRKVKFDKSKRLHTISIWATLVLTSIYFIYLYFTIAKLYSYSFAAMFSAFVNDSNNLSFLVVTVGLYGFMNVLKQKKEKKEKEFHELRCEIVDRSKDLWKKEMEWKNRHIVFEMMKTNYDINLYHEKK
ncbi:YpbF family protein [Neobacillus sp. PS3-40]|uniref:YpbF family protein n=1 Tax=Neobacillus sp. PS3-40 TaxID=3070679 RepID=UPI0027DF51FF|nr:YpbF family protein [Neobacillus sp. PS3-40]WML45146.1 YpbF family protein [Neobacillus sp. PS3-40]